ncbi:DUF6531 domain-containing protein, partial [Escherichia coli]|uniref:DUF6531 domain-containing protein n=1 Tax=Escherichia coli TaxID=562 RepID=UPI000A5002F4
MSGKPAARQGDMTQYGGSIVQGSAGVRIGAPTGVACSVCPGGVTSGHPVNPLLGAKVLPGETDIALPGPLPFTSTHLRPHEHREDPVCRLLLEKQKKNTHISTIST